VTQPKRFSLHRDFTFNSQVLISSPERNMTWSSSDIWRKSIQPTQCQELNL